jgi:hypothetical protein
MDVLVERRLDLFEQAIDRPVCGLGLQGAIIVRIKTLNCVERFTGLFFELR